MSFIYWILYIFGITLPIGEIVIRILAGVTGNTSPYIAIYQVLLTILYFLIFWFGVTLIVNLCYHTPLLSFLESLNP